MNLIIPQGYQSALDIRETEVAIKKVKDFFEKALAVNLNLTRVSAPLFVDPDSGLNDNLNGVERPVSFDILERKGSRNRTFVSQVETSCAGPLWFCSWRGALYGYECDSP